jgi:hypothetical protein
MPLQHRQHAILVRTSRQDGMLYFRGPSPDCTRSHDRADLGQGRRPSLSVPLQPFAVQYDGYFKGHFDRRGAEICVLEPNPEASLGSNSGVPDVIGVDQLRAQLGSQR